MSGDPRTKFVYASVVTRVEILPDTVDLTGFKVPFWPGKILLAHEDPRAAPYVEKYVDGPLTFNVELCRVAIGKMVDRDGEPFAQFDEAHEVLFRMFHQAADYQAPDLLARAQEEVDAFAQEVLSLLLEVPDETLARSLGTRTTTAQVNFVRNRARRAAAGT